MKFKCHFRYIYHICLLNMTFKHKFIKFCIIIFRTLNGHAIMIAINAPLFVSRLKAYSSPVHASTVCLVCTYICYRHIVKPGITHNA